MEAPKIKKWTFLEGLRLHSAWQLQGLNVSLWDSNYHQNLWSQSPHSSLYLIRSNIWTRSRTSKNRAARDTIGWWVFTKKLRSANDTDELSIKLRRSAASFELAQTATDISASPKVVISRSATSQRDVQAMQESKGIREVQPIPSLPNWAGIDGIGVNIRAPTSQEEKFSIILNKAAKHGTVFPIPQKSICLPLFKKTPEAIGTSQRLDNRGKLIEKVAHNSVGVWAFSMASTRSFNSAKPLRIYAQGSLRISLPRATIVLP